MKYFIVMIIWYIIIMLSCLGIIQPISKDSTAIEIINGVNRCLITLMAIFAILLFKFIDNK